VIHLSGGIQIVKRRKGTFLGNGDIICDTATSGEGTLNKFKAKTYDCMVMDICLLDMSGFDVFEKMVKDDWFCCYSDFTSVGE